MKSILLIGALLVCGAMTARNVPDFSLLWNTPGRDASESMPCGGGDIGMNIWVEEGDVLFYISRSGTFDEHNCLLKQGRVRVRITPNPFLENSDFRQELKLDGGYVEVEAGGVKLQLWADVFRPVVHLELESRRPVAVDVAYESWRYRDRPLRKGEMQQNSHKWASPEGRVTSADSISASGNSIIFYHRNPAQTVFDEAVDRQGLNSVKDRMMNPLANLTSGGKLWAEHLRFAGVADGEYAGTDYRSWTLRSPSPLRREHIRIALHTAQTDELSAWYGQLTDTAAGVSTGDKARTRRWWSDFWQRSYVEASGEAREYTRNYTLFRYMLACNAYGSAPSKFNGGLFTFDPCFVDHRKSFTPDFREWGGGTMTAQNQRLIYWGMLKNGDADLMRPQFEVYRRMLRNAELRSEHYWGHPGACFTEQTENYGLPNPAEYGYERPEWFDKGVEYNAWLEYLWDTSLEFCQMILETRRYFNADITPYLPLIESCLTFFDEHYRLLARRRGRRELDGDGCLILYPGSACETYKMAYNAASTVAALRVVLETSGLKPGMLATIPPIPLRVIEGREMIAPAKSWERTNNTETPQLYPVFPWRLYGIGREGLETARNTYLYDPDALRFRSHTGWKQDLIWAACLGLTEEAARLTRLKMANGPHRFPAFWGPGFDWTPDLNHGGSGMIGMQEMLMQEHEGTIYLFPAWPADWDVRFKLHAPGGIVVEAELKGGKVVALKTDGLTPIQSKGKGERIVLCGGITYDQKAFPHSIAGLYPLAGSGRMIYDFNPGWRYYKGDVPGAHALTYDDSAWDVVSTPHTVELMPAEASGGRNYQGPAWYRKRFVIPAETKDRQVVLHFEAVMGKQIIYLNGRQALEHRGGYLPFTVDLTREGCLPGDTCLIAVLADNSDDKSYPPGKPQYALDFAYHGGIYRDVWMIAKSFTAITDAMEEGVAGGGVFVHFDKIDRKSAQVFVETDIKNSERKNRTVTLETTLTDDRGAIVGRRSERVTLAAGESGKVTHRFTVKNPRLWSPDTPYIYHVASRVRSGNTPLDGGVTRIGIRKAEFRGGEGFWLNGAPFGQLVGSNRHQDFAYVGNAAPNSQQWRDARRLRDAGCRIIRTAHYPMDPAFMDACDELGLFVIVATPGWQYWNNDPEFARLVHRNTRQMIRRDRNHPSVLMWEPILNETRYPQDFALEALQITKEEFPWPGRPVAAADMHSAGVRDHYDVVYGWPGDTARQNIFTREFGENVDDWYAHNNNNRASRSWGERPLLLQALSLAKSYGEMFRTRGGFIGGAQWHAFDHQRGYHPDPYWGGLFDAFRQPKYAYWMFRSQAVTGGEPMVYIAHEMGPFSDGDVVVFSNCDSVRLTAYDGARQWTRPVVRTPDGIPNAPVVFRQAWDFWEAREYSYVQKNWQRVSFLAEGLIDGQVVCSERKMPARRSTRLRLSVDRLGRELVADGSDFIVVIAEVTDDSGNVRRPAKEQIVFTVEGEGEIIGEGAGIGANPRAVEFGSAPVLIRSSRQAGKIRVSARVLHEGVHAPTPAVIEFESVPAALPFCFLEQATADVPAIEPQASRQPGANVPTDAEKERMLIETERQQTEFGEKHKTK